MLLPNINEMVLTNYCEWENPQAVYRMLCETDGVDILYRDGVALEHCIKNNDLNSMDLLLSYYMKNCPTRDSIARHHRKLMTILQPLIDEWASPVMRESIASCLSSYDYDYASDDILNYDAKYRRVYIDRMCTAVVATESELRSMIEDEAAKWIKKTQQSAKMTKN